MHTIQKNTKKIWITGFFCCLLALSCPLKSNAENPESNQEPPQTPSIDGKLSLTPPAELNTDTKQNPEDKKLTTNEFADKIQGKKATKKHPAGKDIILAPGRHNTVIVEEYGSNVMTVHGEDKIPENYSNSTNINNGFYMNIINPDGSGMNMGTYFNSNSNSNYPRKRSSAQMIIDKIE